MDPRTLFFLILSTSLLAHTAHAKVTKASATVFKAVSSESDSLVAIGSVEFVDDGSGQVRMSGKLAGLQPEGNHGFHVHELGALFDNCMAAGPHFNPQGKQHGGPSDSERHVGDLGNVVADVSLGIGPIF
jgi:Cu-Zn family superoxide dismutase